MGYQPLEKLLPQANFSIYRLVCMASKRAKELADGSPPLIEIPSSFKTATIALEEILAEKVVLKVVSDQFGFRSKSKHEKVDKKDKVDNLVAAVKD